MKYPVNTHTSRFRFKFLPSVSSPEYRIYTKPNGDGWIVVELSSPDEIWYRIHISKTKWNSKDSFGSELRRREIKHNIFKTKWKRMDSWKYINQIYPTVQNYKKKTLEKIFRKVPKFLPAQNLPKLEYLERHTIHQRTLKLENRAINDE